MIQIVNYTGAMSGSKSKNIKCSKLNNPMSLDEFKINIVDLNDWGVWCSNSNNTDSINCINDIISISTMIKNSVKSKYIIIVPQNIDFKYNFYSNKYNYSVKLKDMINDMRGILYKVHPSFDLIRLFYENTKTKIGYDEIEASFYFANCTDILTSSVGSCKATTIDFREDYNIILTTLKLDSYEKIINFLREIRLIEDKEDEPNWMKTFNMFDDEKQLNIIEENNEVIKKSHENINDALNTINQNKEYKSILYTNGDELVKVVFKILEEIFELDLSDFKDEKKEDFAFKLGEKHFIGEIKGVTSNVRSEHVSQLDVHYQSYIETNDLESNKAKAILIINHQRKNSLDVRQPVHEIQINLAKRNESLIVETITLLRLFEKYKNGDVKSSECIDLFFNNIGLLQLQS